MAKSIVIPMVTPMTVGGVANVLVMDTSSSGFYLRKFDDNGNYVSEHAGSSVSSGYWRFDVEEGNYQLWKSAYPDNTGSNRVDRWHGGSNKYRRISDEAESQYPLLSQSNTFTGDTNHFKAALFADTVTMEDASVQTSPYIDDQSDLYLRIEEPDSNHLVWRRWVEENSTVNNGNTIFVNSEYASDVVGKRYRAPEDAINYAVSQTPAANKIFDIALYPHKNRSLGYQNNIVCQPYVNLWGIGLVKITGTMSGFSLNTKLGNLFLDFGPANVAVNAALAYNVIFRLSDPEDTGFVMTITNSRLYFPMLYSVGSFVDTKIVSGGGNRIIRGFANKPIIDIADTEYIDVATANEPTLDFQF